MKQYKRIQIAKEALETIRRRYFSNKSGKKIITLFILLISFNSVAQTTVFRHPIHLKSQKDVFPIKSISGDTLALFLLDRLEINAVLLSKDYKFIKELSFPKPNNSIQDIIIGYQIIGAEYSIFYSNEKRSKFSSFTIDFKENKCYKNTIDLTFSKEKYLEGISVDNNFYLLTIPKGTSDIEVYKFDNPKYPSKITYSFDSIKFQNHYPQLYYTFLDKKSTRDELKVEKFSLDSPPLSLQNTWHKEKLYYHDKKIVILLDHLLDRTLILTLDLSSHAANFEEVLKPEIENARASNSVLYDGKLFQGIVGLKECSIRVCNINDQQIIKGYHFDSKEGSLTFSNMPIMQKVPDLESDNKVIMRNFTSSQLLRKISNSTLSLAVNKNRAGNLELAIGSYKEPSGSIPVPVGIIGGFAGGAIAMAALAYNSNYYQYKAYGFSNSVYFMSIIDPQTCEHLPGPVSFPKVELIQSFEEKISSKISATTVFKVGDSLLYGYYNESDENYYLVEF